MSWVDTKYIGLMGQRLTRFKSTGTNIHTFRCPYCGDSEKYDHKTRGYFFLYKDDHFFKCHNCGVSRSVRQFLKEIFPDMYRSYLFDYFGGETERKKQQEEIEAFKVDLTTRFKNKRLLESFPKLSDLGEKNEGLIYLRKRKIPEKFFPHLHYVRDVNLLFEKLGERYKEVRHKKAFSAIMIPFMDRKNVKIMFVQLRYLDENAPARYKTLEVDGGEKVWGLNFLDFTKKIHIFEGAFDAMFLDNSISSGGADLIELGLKLKEETGKEVVLVWDSDFSSNIEVQKRLKAAVDAGLRVTLSDADLGGKDVNESVMNGTSIDGAEKYIKARTFSGLNAELELSKYKKPTAEKKRNANFKSKKPKNLPVM